MSVTERDRPSRERAVRVEAAGQGRPRRGRPARAHILMALAGLCTAVAVYVALQDGDPGQRVLVATSELRVGTVVPPETLAAVTVDVGAEQAARLVPAEQVDATVGQVVVNSLMPGDLVGLSDLRRPAAPEDRRAIALPVPRERAVAGDLQTGDRVDVIAVEEGLARYVATGLPVIASGGGGGGVLDGDTGNWSLTVSVDEQDALALARALADAEVTVTRATGATPADPRAVESGGSPQVGDDARDGRGGRRGRRARDDTTESGGEDALTNAGG